MPLIGFTRGHVARPPSLAITGLHVQGNQLLNSMGQPLRLRGVNRSGTEVECIHKNGIFDGPSDAASVRAIASWHVNAVRVPLNEDCWLGINGVPAAFSGTAYQQAIANYVKLLNQYGLITILDLHWNAPGTAPATSQQPMPDRDHAVTFWTQVAAAFKSNSSVIFDLYNEPFPDFDRDTPTAWRCWRDGGACPGVPFRAAGMQELVGAIRHTGATNVIMLGGIVYATSLSQWLTYKPVDPLHNLVASWHSYNFNICNTPSCWTRIVAPVAAQYPVVAGEIGEKDRNHRYVETVIGWLDQQGQSYVAWAWNTWYDWQSLITDYSGTPNRANYGAAYHDHLATETMVRETGIPTTAATLSARGDSTHAGSLVAEPLQLSNGTVSRGRMLTANVTLQNAGGSITLLALVIAGRPPGGTIAGGPYDDFGGTGRVVLRPGQHFTVRAARRFSASDPVGTWYAFLTYQTLDGTWHDDPTVVSFTVR